MIAYRIFLKRDGNKDTQEREIKRNSFSCHFRFLGRSLCEGLSVQKSLFFSVPPFPTSRNKLKKNPADPIKTSSLKIRRSTNFRLSRNIDPRILIAALVKCSVGKV